MAPFTVLGAPGLEVCFLSRPPYQRLIAGVSEPRLPTDQTSVLPACLHITGNLTNFRARKRYQRGSQKALSDHSAGCYSVLDYSMFSLCTRSETFILYVFLSITHALEVEIKKKNLQMKYENVNALKKVDLCKSVIETTCF